MRLDRSGFGGALSLTVPFVASSPAGVMFDNFCKSVDEWQIDRRLAKRVYDRTSQATSF